MFHRNRFKYFFQGENYSIHPLSQVGSGFGSDKKRSDRPKNTRYESSPLNLGQPSITHEIQKYVLKKRKNNYIQGVSSPKYLSKIFLSILNDLTRNLLVIKKRLCQILCKFTTACKLKSSG